jgi:excinuclease ABC subunit A
VIKKGPKGNLPIVVRGAREHNLRNVSLELPRNQLICFTGVSGSGKSSLAFDTLFAEGQRRYLESLSTYARQFVGQMPKPDVDLLSGLAPAISISQKSTGHNPRSTVGTITELSDFLRVLFARCGTGFCPACNIPISQQTRDQLIEKIRGLLPKKSSKSKTSKASAPWFAILAPLVRNQKGTHKDLFAQMRRFGFNRVRADANLYALSSPPDLEKQYKHDIDVVVDRIQIRPELFEPPDLDLLIESIDKALKLGEGSMILSPAILLGNDTSNADVDWACDPANDVIYSEHYVCSKCGTSYPTPTPQLLSFNSPQGACPDCEGLGQASFFTEDSLVKDPALSIRQGAIEPLGKWDLMPIWLKQALATLCDTIKKRDKFPKDLTKMAWKDIPEPIRKFMLVTDSYFGPIVRQASIGNRFYDGIATDLMFIYRSTTSETVRNRYQRYLQQTTCPGCDGQRLNRQARWIKLKTGSMAFDQTTAWKSIGQCSSMSIDQAIDFFASLELTTTQEIIATEALKEVRSRLSFLQDVGLGYLSLDRAAPTLSGGESQRIRLASQIGAGLTGVLYVLDEPSIGLHARDNEKLLRSLKKLRDIGNSLIVVEHDEDTMRAADMLVDFGPGPGVKGGELIAIGSLEDVSRNQQSLTGQFLSRTRVIRRPQQRRKGTGKTLSVLGARHNNLRNIDVDFPLGCLIAVTGVSGSGKSSLVTDILSPALRNALNGAQDTPGEHSKIVGLEHLDKLIEIDQTPIGRTPRSNPATYIKLFDEIRDLFAQLPESKRRGFAPGTFSFNTELGRCSMCEGHGALRLDMEFLADIWVPCPVCEGKRYCRSTLQVLFKGMSIADCLDLDAQQALEHFDAFPKITSKLKTLADVGLEYLKLGQPSPSLSGGEAQRIKLSRELSKRGTGQTMYVLDEPTTGLHFHDIDLLLQVLHNLVDKGNTVVVVEHNLDLIQAADWVIDLGPEGGAGGGTLLCCGTPEQVSEESISFTGIALKQHLATHGDKPASKKKRSNPKKKTAGTGLSSEAASLTGPALEDIHVIGATQHNLKNIEASIPKHAMTVFCGHSGSGKTSLAMETIYAEGQRRYVESLSPYVRQFVGQMPKPPIERIDGLAPSIAIEQKGLSHTPRSTVGTVTEIYDYFRVLFARMGKQHCTQCDAPVESQTIDQILDRWMQKKSDAIANPNHPQRCLILAPVSPNANQTIESFLQDLVRSGYTRIRINGKTHSIDDSLRISAKQVQQLQVVVDRIQFDQVDRKRLAESAGSALGLGLGIAQLALVDDARAENRWTVETYSLHSACHACGISFEPLTPHSFSFNSSVGWCEACSGLGTQKGTDPMHFIDGGLSLLDGGLKLWQPGDDRLAIAIFRALGRHLELPVEEPFLQWNNTQLHKFFQGANQVHIPVYRSDLEEVAKTRSYADLSAQDPWFHFRYEGIIPTLELMSKVSHDVRYRLQEHLADVACRVCGGSKINPKASSMRWFGRRIGELMLMPLDELLVWIKTISLSKHQSQVGGELLREITQRVEFLIDVGLHYLTLGRTANTLSGGESQRIRLASQLGTGLCGVLYVLDEPTIGLHPRDNDKLIRAMHKLRDLGNTLLVVEHDRDVIRSSDAICDFGPGAGPLGGRIVAQGTLEQIVGNPNSITGPYLKGSKSIQIDNTRPEIIDPVSLREKPGVKWLTVHQAAHNTLKKIDVAFPLEHLIAVTGPSGSGKSSLVQGILYPALASRFHRSNLIPGIHARIEGVDQLNKVMQVDQSPLGNSPSSTPATYTGVFDLIRQFYANQSESGVYHSSYFSFNAGPGRCTACDGLGKRCIEMHFLPDVWIQCEVCQGKRFQDRVLAIKFRGHSINDVLESTTAEALELFEDQTKIARMLSVMCDVGLSYVKLGQSAPTLSGGEAQRVKLAAELVRPTTGKTLFVLDEPTTGLHFDDINKLMKVLNRLVDQGNSVIIIEHNLEVIRNVDWIVDLGPEAGRKGGHLVFEGSPQAMIDHARRCHHPSSEKELLKRHTLPWARHPSYTADALAQWESIRVDEVGSPNRKPTKKSAAYTRKKPRK